MRSALFLDRDGVINVDHGYVYKPDQIEFIDGIFELVEAAKKANFLVVIVTNQAGIGRGYYTEKDFRVLMGWMQEQFVEHHGQIDAVYFSPYHPEFGIGEYKRESKCRKPSPGMFLQAKDEFDIDMGKSLLIGDNLSDMIAGKKAGVGGLLLFGREDVERSYLTIKNLSDALPFLLQS